MSAIGLDHRLGWVAFGGLVSMLKTLVAYLNVEWDLDPGFNRHSLESAWKAEIMLEIGAAAVTQEILMVITGRITPFVILCRAFVQPIMFYLLIVPAFTSILLVFRRPLSLILHRLVRIVSGWPLVTGLSLYVAAVALVQVFVEMEEVADLKLGFVFPWNWNWQYPGPMSWWVL